MLKLKDSEFHYFVDFVKKNYGINLINKRVLIEGRLSSYLAQRGFADYQAYINLLETDKTGQELTNLLNKVTTNHTYFMREADHFEYLSKTVFPYLERTVTDRDLRIWCAASSTGEEPYTLAMLLEDYFGKKQQKWDKKILASDLSLKVLGEAKEGIYSEEAIESVPEHWKKNYFTKVGSDNVQVIPRLKSEVVFRQINLMDPLVVKKPYHVVFCRNVMIYFDMPTKSQLIDRIYDNMRPGGYLFIGQTESAPKPTRFNYIMPSVYQKGV